MTDMPATQHRITLLEWVGIAAGVLALVASFLPWYQLSSSLAERVRVTGASTWTSVWKMNFLGWFPIVLLVAVAVLIGAQQFGKRLQILASLWMTLAVLAVVMIVLRWITVPKSGSDAALVAGFGLYVGLGAGIVSVVTGFLSFRATQHETPAD